MDTLTIDAPIPYLLPPNQPIQIGLVGCGGTGSHLAVALARMASHLRERGDPPLHLIFIDGDRVEAPNIGRQLFAPAERGRHKAQTLADRLNAALGLDIIAVPEMATAALLRELAPPAQTIGILVGAVDTASGRRALHEALAHSRWQLWLDSGNEHAWGKVLLGTTTEQRQLRGALALGGICTALPAPTLCYPHLLHDEPADQRAGDAHHRGGVTPTNRLPNTPPDRPSRNQHHRGEVTPTNHLPNTPPDRPPRNAHHQGEVTTASRLRNQPQGDCAADMRDGLQSLMINQTMAAIAAQYLHQLISARRITTFETALDLANLTMCSIPITAATLADASGLTIADITQTDEPGHHRTRGHP
ncbi:ThiF family adenylyltransferase [Candidatus Chloroploca sp. M-50]|uniref:ThiF family adenylyltransferase n=1 Tax=Candidatus Chloroploca mongolica TaxID=2528176 RepID=A0ABS4D9W7_9CHLR|nr:ThiF family adenylyltransferase [Candidatus Chloroploca mongolica]MBP1466218.1 ThiF family adenylyltransferase [Candidatus Chloroploca mongolica]